MEDVTALRGIVRKGLGMAKWSTKEETIHLPAAQVSDPAQIRAAARLGYRLGFEASAEGWNGEYPFDGEVLEADTGWVAKRDHVLIALIDTPPAVSDEREQLKEAFFAGFAEGADGTWVEGDATPAWENYVKSTL